MDITYKKTNNSHLFKDFENDELLNMTACQNYIPIYTKFFRLTNKNFNSINLNNQYTLHSLTKKNTENIFEGTIKNEKGEIVSGTVFFKLSPLLDPFKYLAGKYDMNNPNLFNLPKLDDDNCLAKITDSNNAAYVDSFFTYLTSQLLNRKGFLHGLDFYGSFLGVKNDYHVDIGDDLDMLASSTFFHQQNNNLYSFLNTEHEDIFNDDSRSNKKQLSLGEEILDLNVLSLEDVGSLDSHTVENNEEFTVDDTALIYEDNASHKDAASTHSEISSRSSNTDTGVEQSTEGSEESESESSEEENIMVSIKSFPIQLISLEKCDSTLDKLFVDEKLGVEELSCIVVQILMMLITYQKLFDLTHNDLHTNNIMYIKTEKKYLYYKLDGKHYKVQTFGKIFKIIDFGRAIYKYKGNIICSDSFHKDGDAATQYNCEPYYNDKKSLIEPNSSFDLCRLGCSMYDFIMEEYESLDDNIAPIHKIIMRWCDDDNKRNILYKDTDEERYPDFKLYKMIARKVHKHIPSKELQHKHFDKFIVPKKEIKKGSKILNIDTIDLDSPDLQEPVDLI
jgi:hypothetical protein